MSNLLPDSTFIDQYIADGQNATYSLKNFYDTKLIATSSDISHVYRTPFDDFFIQYRSELEKIIQLYTIPQSMFYRPKTVSLDLYGTTELWLSLLRVNDMKNITEFHKPIILVYHPKYIFELMKIFFKRDDKY